MNDPITLAEQYFMQGYSCAQAVALAFHEYTGLDAQTTARLSSSFGAGMGRLREVCGAVSGMMLTAGMLYGYESPEDYSGKTNHYTRVQQLAEQFKQQNGSYICRELLGRAKEAPQPEKRTPAYYAKRPCTAMVRSAAQILKEYIENHPDMPYNKVT